MQVTLLGLGGSEDTLTAGAKKALENAGLILGASRMLSSLTIGSHAEKIPCYMPNEQIDYILQKNTDTCIVYSGDTGFYSGARGIIPELKRRNIPYRLIAGISSVQLLSSALGEPWQDWKLVSAHGVKCNPVCEIMEGKDVFFLTGGELSAQEICRILDEADLGELNAVVGENLSYPNERITRNTAAELAKYDFSPLSVLLVYNKENGKKFSAGIADEEFVRGNVPMTKREIRAIIPSLLEIQPSDTVWDIGAGTGSVSAELALTAYKGRTYAVECNADGVELIGINRKKFGAWNLNIKEGRAPQALNELPAPDAVFIGGTKGSIAEILDAVIQKNPNARICLSAIAAETLGNTVSAMAERGFKIQITQICSSRSKEVGKLHMMMANNPVYLITGAKR